MAAPPAHAARLERWLLLLLLLAVFSRHDVQAADAELAEYQIKAAFLCKFGHYVEWPDDAASALPFVIGVMASPSMADELALAARGQQVQGRPLQVRRIERVAGAVEGLSLMFIARSHVAQAAEVLATLRDRPVLTVTELAPEAASPDGLGIINFVVVDDKVRFDVALPTATPAGLRISARLLAVARHVSGRSTP